MSGLSIGLGCRKGVSGEVITTLVLRLLWELDVSTDDAQLYSIEDKKYEPGLLDAASALDMPIHFLPRAKLAQTNGKGPTRSLRVQEQFGLDSISETAALAGAGNGAKLLIARQAENGATCAIAQGAVR